MPGIDGLPIEFYKCFFETMENDLVTLYNDILFGKKQLSPTMKNAIITLLPKKGDLNEIKNWRPISLLCTDYKILTKITANRLRPTMKEVISEEQTCTFPGRNIFSNLFLVRELIYYTKEKNIEGYILSIDQEKAFDKVNHNKL